MLWVWGARHRAHLFSTSSSQQRLGRQACGQMGSQVRCRPGTQAGRQARQQGEADRDRVCELTCWTVVLVTQRRQGHGGIAPHLAVDPGVSQGSSQSLWGAQQRDMQQWPSAAAVEAGAAAGRA